MTDTPAEQLAGMIDGMDYPCVGAKSALAKDNITMLTVGNIHGDADDGAIYAALLKQRDLHARRDEPFQSLAVIFDDDTSMDEREFEAALWDKLIALTQIDTAQGHKHDPRVSSDPASPHFAVSFGGAGFFVVGLHPQSSRRARQFARPVMIFNIHEQFEQLRAKGIYDSMHDTIMARDIKRAGSVNPMLARHGEKSAAPQYSGRDTPTDWQCPFSRAQSKHATSAHRETTSSIPAHPELVEGFRHKASTSSA